MSDLTHAWNSCLPHPPLHRGGNISRDMKTKFTGKTVTALLQVRWISWICFHFQLRKCECLFEFCISSLFMLQLGLSRTLVHDVDCLRVGFVWFLISYHFLSWRSIYEDITWICHFENPTAVYMVKGRDLFVNEWLENYACHTCASGTLG